MLHYLEEVRHMSKTVVRKNESLDDALRRFKRSVTKAGTLQESRKIFQRAGKFTSLDRQKFKPKFQVEISHP